jgi:NAD-dependent DNA ligase
VKPEDYPTLYSECNACAESNQEKHFQLLQVEIVLLIAIAILGAINWSSFPSFGILPPLIIAVSLAILFVFTVIMESKKFEKNWYTSRAVAEIIKRESWLYMMKAKPYNQQREQQAKAKFKKFLKQIVESQALPWRELIHNIEVTQITETMDKKRNASFDEQKEFYIASRINDQRSWYTKKAKMNHLRESRMTTLMWILLALSVALAFVNIISNDLPINAVGIATTASAAVLSWIGAKNYGELSQSYSIVAHELSFLEDDAKQAKTEDQLINIVLDAEDTMSQEQKIWKIKRLP